MENLTPEQGAVGKKVPAGAYKCIFFDLDHTLWDFEKNSREALVEMYHHFELSKTGISSIDEFIDHYYVINEEMWDKYSKDIISKDELRNDRFYLALKNFNINNRELGEKMATYYVSASPYKTHLFKDCHLVLTELKKKFKLHIITNGFEEVQYIKLNTTGLTSYFEHVVTSEKAGVKKPAKGIFDYALKLSGAELEKSIMIGDGIETDILAAKNAGMDQVFFNPKKHQINFSPTHTIVELSQLLELL